MAVPMTMAVSVAMYMRVRMSMGMRLAVRMSMPMRTVSMPVRMLYRWADKQSTK